MIDYIFGKILNTTVYMCENAYVGWGNACIGWGNAFIGRLSNISFHKNDLDENNMA